MRRTSTLSFAVLLATFTVQALNGPVFAGVRLPRTLVEVAPDLADMVDAALKISTNDVPGLVSDDLSLSDYAKRVAKVHFGHESPKEPTVNGDRVFSPTPNVRATARKEYADFVAAEAKDIDRIKDRRDDRAVALKTYEQIDKRYSEYMNRAPDLIDAAGRANNYQLAVELASRLHNATLVKPDLDIIEKEYRRLVEEYDEAIRKAQIEHKAHVAGLKALDAIMPANDYRPSVSNEHQAPNGLVTPTQPDNAGATSERTSGYAERLKSTVRNSTVQTNYRASQASASIEITKRRIGPPPAAASRPMTVFPAPGKNDAWRGEIQTYERPADR